MLCWTAGYLLCLQLHNYTRIRLQELGRISKPFLTNVWSSFAVFLTELRWGNVNLHHCINEHRGHCILVNNNMSREEKIVKLQVVLSWTFNPTPKRCGNRCLRKHDQSKIQMYQVCVQDIRSLLFSAKGCIWYLPTNLQYHPSYEWLI